MNCEEFVIDLLQNYMNANGDMKQDNDRLQKEKDELQKEKNMMKELINRLLHEANAYTYPDGGWQLNVSYDAKTAEKMDKLFKELNIPNPFTSFNF